MNQELREARNLYYLDRENDALFDRYVHLLARNGFDEEALKEAVLRIAAYQQAIHGEGFPGSMLDRLRDDPNAKGNSVHDWGVYSHPARDRYYFDFSRHGDTHSGFSWFTGVRDGWKQYDTGEDASYFGVWVNEDKRLTLTYAEGDVTLVIAPTQTSFDAEIAHMNKFYQGEIDHESEGHI